MKKGKIFFALAATAALILGACGNSETKKKVITIH